MKLTIDEIEKNELEVVEKLQLPNNAICFDIGCSYGAKTQEYIDKLNGTDFTIHCFEPLPLQYNQEVEKYGHLDNIHLNNVALSNESGTLPFYWVETWPVLSGFDRQSGKHASIPYTVIDVSVLTLDGYISENNISHIDWMKIDVEGGEFSVLKGGKEMLRNGIVDMIQFEYGITWATPNIKMSDVIEYVGEFDYKVCSYNAGKFTEITDFEENYDYNILYIMKDSSIILY
jgi:FkbM family methyltransferase